MPARGKALTFAQLRAGQQVYLSEDGSELRHEGRKANWTAAAADVRQEFATTSRWYDRFECPDCGYRTHQ